MTTNRVFAVSMLLSMLFHLGCATYVNIPPQRGDVAWHNPNNPNVLSVEAEAIKAAVVDWEIDEPYTVKVLPNTEPLKYFAMMRHIGHHATVDEIENGATIEVKQLYIRGMTAKVDLLRSPSKNAAMTSDAKDRDPRLVSVHLEWLPINGWQAKHVKVWQVDVGKMLAPTGPFTDVGWES